MDTFLIVSTSISASRVVLALVLNSLYASAAAQYLRARSMRRARNKMHLLH